MGNLTNKLKECEGKKVSLTYDGCLNCGWKEMKPPLKLRGVLVSVGFYGCLLRLETSEQNVVLDNLCVTSVSLL
jgi:hypothetical protein